METNTQEFINNIKASKKNFFNSLFYNKKYLLFFVTGVMIVFIIIIVFVNTLNSKQEQITVSPSPTIGLQNTQSPVQQLSETEKKDLQTQIAPQIENAVEGSYEITKTKVYEDGWTLVQITAPGADFANIIIKRTGNSWKVIEGPGTYFDKEAMQQDNAPEDLQKDANTTSY